MGHEMIDKTDYSVIYYSGVIQPVRTGSAEPVVKFRIVRRTGCYLLRTVIRVLVVNR